MELDLCAVDANLENIEFFSPEISKPRKMHKARLRIQKTVSATHSEVNFIHKLWGAPERDLDYILFGVYI